MTNSSRKFIEDKKPYDVEIESRDELSDLNHAIRTISSLARSQERSS